MTCTHPLDAYKARTGQVLFKEPANEATVRLKVPCGRCIGCRIDNAQMWTTRMTHEASLYSENCFVTLTYSPQNLPADWSLDKTEAQRFLKRLRKKVPQKFKYYLVGEYGDQNLRPHYHICMFNLDFPDRIQWKDKGSYTVDTSQLLEETWGRGFTTVSTFTRETALYCAKYITKKITGNQAEKHYTRKFPDGRIVKVQPEFATMSRNPGLGSRYLARHKDDIYPMDGVVTGDGQVVRVPRYYDNKMAEQDESFMEGVKARRTQKRKANAEAYEDDKLIAKDKILKSKHALFSKREV